MVIISCKNSEEKDAQGDNMEETISAKKSGESANVKIPTYAGEFIFVEEGAVLKGRNFIYGVAVDDMSRELAEQVEKIKNDEFDMVGVIVRGILTEKAEGEDGWDEVLTIKQIVSVSDSPSPADIQIEEKK